MLSKVELQYLRSPDAFSADYQRILRHRIRRKVQQLKALLPLLEARGYNVTDCCNSVTEFYNGQGCLNQAASNKIMVRSPGFEPGSSAWQADVLDQARLRPL